MDKFKSGSNDKYCSHQRTNIVEMLWVALFQYRVVFRGKRENKVQVRGDANMSTKVSKANKAIRAENNAGTFQLPNWLLSNGTVGGKLPEKDGDGDF